MGIGNTTSSSAILAVLSGKEVTGLVGKGTGITLEKVIHKQNVINRGIKARKPDPTDPLDVLAKLGGFEIAAMAGAMLAGAVHRIPILVDGFICSVAALVATAINSTVRDYMIVGHRSTEKETRFIKPFLREEIFEVFYPILFLQKS
jgi:nicotinate-nucleotide--dimethylbenzimidazole phosphoribosyltransferase